MCVLVWVRVHVCVLCVYVFVCVWTCVCVCLWACVCACVRVPFFCNPSPDRPSEVAAAVRVLEAGHAQGDDICSLWYQLDAGQHMLQVTRGIVVRNNSDLLGDGNLVAATELLDCVDESVLKHEITLTAGLRRMETIQPAITKLASALSSWGQRRLEEQLDACEDVMRLILRLLLHSATLTILHVTVPVAEAVGRLRGLCFKPDGGFAITLVGQPDPGRIGADVIRSLRDVYILTCDAIDESAALEDQVHKQAKAYSSFFTNIRNADRLKDDQGLVELCDTYKSGTTSTLKYTRLREQMCEFLEAVYGALNHKQITYPVVLEDYDEFVTRRRTNEEQSQSVCSSSRQDLVMATPFIEHVHVALSRQEDLLSEDWWPHTEFEIVATNVPSPEAMEGVAEMLWAAQSGFAHLIRTELWPASLDLCLQGVAQTAALQSILAVSERTAISPDVHGLALIIGGDAKAMSTEVSDHCADESRANAPIKFAHVGAVLRVQNVIRMTNGVSNDGIHTSAFQNAVGVASAIPFDVMNALLDVYSQARTVMGTCAAVGCAVAEGADALFDYPFVKARVKGDTPTQFGVKPRVVQMLDLLAGTLNALSDYMDAPLLVGVDEKGYNLLKSVSTMKLWHASVDRFKASCHKEVLGLVVSTAHKHAEDVHKLTPQDSYKDALDLDFEQEYAVETILNAPKHVLIKPETKFLAALTDFYDVYAIRWEVTELLWPKPKRLMVSKAIDNGEDFLLVRAAVNAIINADNFADIATTAGEIKTIASKKKTFSFPAAVSARLEALRQVIPQTRDAIASAPMVGSVPPTGAVQASPVVRTLAALTANTRIARKRSLDSSSIAAALTEASESTRLDGSMAVSRPVAPSSVAGSADGSMSQVPAFMRAARSKASRRRL